MVTKPTTKLDLLSALLYGAGGGPGGEVLAPASPAPKFVPNTTPEVDLPMDDLGINTVNMPAETMVGNPNLTPTQMAAGEASLKGGKKSSTARAANPKPEAAKPAENAAQPAAIGAAKPTDQIYDMLLGKKAEAEGERDTAKDKALHAKDLSDGEKIFTALMAVLPGLVGGVAGGAIAGGTGAASGFAGGLQGAATGVGMMNADKEQHRQEALDEMKAAQGRVDQAGNQVLGHQEKLGDREFSVGERKAGEQFAVANREDQQSFSAQQATKSMGHAEKLQLMQQRHQFELAKMNNEAELQKAAAAAAAKGGGETKEFQAKAARFAGDMAIASDDIDKFTRGIAGQPLQGAIANESWANLFKNPETQKFAIAVARFSNAFNHGTSGASISEEEWKQARAMFVPMSTDSPSATEQKQKYRQDAAMSFFQEAGPAQASVQQRLNQYYGTASSGSTNDQEALAWLADPKNANDPNYAQVKALVGAK